MDFEKIKPAVQEINLSKNDTEEIISFCSGKKRKFNYKPLIGIAAAAAVATVVVSAPAFLFKASAPAETDNMLAEDVKADFDFYYTADTPAESIAHQSSNTSADITLFETEGFADIYAIIPHEFASLVNADEYAEWKDTVSAEHGMAMVQFVEYFDISVSDFKTANTEYCERISDSLSDSPYSGGFDADIIFSFDRELTDSFYSMQ